MGLAGLELKPDDEGLKTSSEPRESLRKGGISGDGLLA